MFERLDMKSATATVVLVSLLAIVGCGDGDAPTGGGGGPTDKAADAAKDTSTDADTKEQRKQKVLTTVRRIERLREAMSEMEELVLRIEVDNAQHEAIEDLLARLRESPVSAELIESMDAAALGDTDNDGEQEILDAWGRPLAFGVRVGHNDTDAADDFLPAEPIIVASAGPDGDFGHFKNDPDSPAVADNIYSHALEDALKHHGLESGSTADGETKDREDQGKQGK